MSASKQKGTGEETAVKRDWEADGFVARRMPASSLYDVEVEVGGFEEAMDVLTMRADRGERLAIIRHEDLRKLLIAAKVSGVGPVVLHEEVKRYARVSVWAIFKKKFVATHIHGFVSRAV